MPSWVLRVNARFEAAHHLTSYRGAPEPVHGHTWRVEAALPTETLDAEGMGFDFMAIKAALAELAAVLDHRDVNTIPPFDRLSPTTERLAAWFYEGLAARLPGVPLAEVTVWEGPDCSATYRPS
ncbi:MAG: 6-pyruvoyltetrahydropterin/6-carboxytetrahydropterin synthase [Acidobacteriota bacterium]|nr:6-pyruvoyltetrahydropterin/6-carboxytetrahydropterin synthase [Acidobacteriota bacterium]